ARLSRPRVRFIFLDPAPPEISTLSLHDALPIYGCRDRTQPRRRRAGAAVFARRASRYAAARSRHFPALLFLAGRQPDPDRPSARSEEHTSELQSRENLVCRLLLEKKKHKPNRCI